MKTLGRLTLLLGLVLPVLAQEHTQAKQDKQPQSGGGAIVYAQGGGFLITGPKGWTMDTKEGQRLGACCVYYPEGSTWDDAETVIYPNIVSKGPGEQTLEELMNNDLNDFRDHNPGMSFEDGVDVPIPHGRSARIRFFYGVNHGSSEAVAYINEDKIIALVVMSSKTTKQLNQDLPLLKATLATYAHMDVQFANSAGPDKKKSFQPPKD